MDADDISLPTRFAEQTAFMDANPDIAILGAWSENFGTYAGFDIPPAKPDEIKIWLIFSYTMVHTSIFLRRNVFIEHGLFYPDGFVQEDYALWCDALTQGLKAAYTDKRLRIISNPARHGISKSLNMAIDSAAGQYIARMDADDIALPHRFEKQIEFLDAHREIDVCGAMSLRIDAKGRRA